MDRFHILALSIAITLVLGQGNITAQTIQWEQTNGPFGGNVASLAVAENGALFAGTAFGVFRSIDNGNNWIQVYKSAESYRVTSLAILPDRTILAGTFGAGIFVSKNAGDSWKELNEGLTSPEVLALTSNQAGDAFAGTQNGGIFKLANSAVAWESASEGLSDPFVRALAVRANGDIFAGTFRSGIFCSRDQGRTWQSTSAGLTENNISSLTITANDEVLAGTFGAGVFLLDETSNRWQDLGTVSRNGIILGLTSTEDGAIFAGTTEGVIRAETAGAVWRAINSGLTARNVLALAVNRQQELFAGAQLGGVFRSSNSGGNWTEVNQGLINTDVIDMTGNQADDIFAGTFANGVFRSSDNGDNWVQINEGLTCTCALSLLANQNGMLFLVTAEGVFRSVDNGDTWTPINSGLENAAQDSKESAVEGERVLKTIFPKKKATKTFWRTQAAAASAAGITELAISDQSILYAGTFGRGIFRSMDDGDSWQPLNNGLTNEFVTALSVSASGVLFAGTLEGIFRSVDGQNWISFNSGITIPNINGFEFSDDGTAFVATNGGGISRLLQGNTVWETINVGLDGDGLFVMNLVDTGTGGLLAGTNGGGCFISNDQGNSWQEVNDGLSNHLVLSLYVKEDGNFLAGTNGSGVFRTLQNVTSVDVGQAQPTQFVLEQNFPNPFNPETRIGFTLAEPAQIQLEIYNLLGQKIATLVDGQLAAGSRSVIWDGRDNFGSQVSSGVYVYQINVRPTSPGSQPFQEYRKMLLVR